MYVNDMNCEYTVLGDGREIELTLENVDIEEYTDCKWDSIEVRPQKLTHTIYRDFFQH